MSLGSSTPSDGQDALSLSVNRAVVEKGKVVVVAAGNSGDDQSTVGSPGAAARAITVGAVAEWSAPTGAPNHSDGVYLAYFSSRGPTLDGAPSPTSRRRASPSRRPRPEQRAATSRSAGRRWPPRSSPARWPSASRPIHRGRRTTSGARSKERPRTAAQPARTTTGEPASWTATASWPGPRGRRA